MKEPSPRNSIRRRPFSTLRATGVGTVGALRLDATVSALDYELGVAALPALRSPGPHGLVFRRVGVLTGAGNAQNPPALALGRRNRESLSCCHLVGPSVIRSAASLRTTLDYPPSVVDKRRNSGTLPGSATHGDV